MSTRVGFKARKFRTVQIRLREGTAPDTARQGYLKLYKADTSNLIVRGDDALNPRKLAEPLDADRFEWFGPDVLAAVLLDGKEIPAP